MDGKSILVIDADPASRNFLARALQSRQYAVLLAASGREGLIAAWRDRPDLIILDPVLTDLPGELLIEKLRADARTAAVPIVVLSSDATPARQKACLQAGCNHFLVKSGQALPNLLELLPGLLFAPSAPQPATTAGPGGAQIVFLSAKGGTGTSSLTANIAHCILRQKPELNLAVVDLVLPIGSIAQIVNHGGPVNLATLAELEPSNLTPQYLRETLPRPPLWEFALVAGSPDPETANLLKVTRIPEVLAGLRRAFDLVIIDLGRSLSKISLPVIEQAEVVVPIISTDLSAVELTRTVWDYLKQSVSPQTVYAILNRPVGLEGLTRTDVERLSGLTIRVTMPYMGGNLTMANNQHQPVAHKFPKDSATLMLMQAAREILEMAGRRTNR